MIVLCLNWGRKDQTPGHVDQSPKMEHHLTWDEGRLLEVNLLNKEDKPGPEETPETEVTSEGQLVVGCLGMKDAVNVWIHHTSLQMQVCCYRSQELDKNSGGSG